MKQFCSASKAKPRPSISKAAKHAENSNIQRPTFSLKRNDRKIPASAIQPPVTLQNAGKNPSVQEPKFGAGAPSVGRSADFPVRSNVQPVMGRLPRTRYPPFKNVSCCGLESPRSERVRGPIMPVLLFEGV